MSPRVALGNIEDADAFVRHCMGKVRIQMTEDQREELHAEGMAILVELHKRYDAGRDKMSDARTGGFFGYALYLLPRKLGDAWHGMNPHHVLRTQPDGTRRYEYLDAEVSLDDDERARVVVDARTLEDAIENDRDVREESHAPGYRAPGAVASAVGVMRGMERTMAGPVLRLMESGYNSREIAARLGVKYGMVQQTAAAVGSAIWLVGQQEAA